MNKEAMAPSVGKRWLKWMLRYRFVLVVLVIAFQNMVFVISSTRTDPLLSP